MNDEPGCFEGERQHHAHGGLFGTAEAASDLALLPTRATVAARPATQPIGLLLRVAASEAHDNFAHEKCRNTAVTVLDISDPLC
ncbi:hypothetical protein LPW26_17285 [Rhodopseudomonas sp. HC1]|uniref:hypothetical protein n=1 Tax=Rhodopseudomonas infernalis TaxID=2897386 RepID=UPI001EE7F5AB|nr:hypothetical protein [Rhodopseudomonas infernalis]MCG6206404.1 hypothetical protein [Rhodopseudomonas infernalis]